MPKNEVDKVSIFKKRFWDLWVMKILRNFASMKFQLMLMMAIPTLYGMLTGEYINGEFVSKIPPVVGYSFLTGGFITLAGSRIVAKTSLTSTEEDELDTDK